jgi:hypothetical protein
MRPIALDVFFEKRDDILNLADFPVAVGVPQIGDEFGGGFDAYVVFYERLFEFVEQVIIDVSADTEDGGQRRADFVAGFAKPVFEVADCFGKYAHS